MPNPVNVRLITFDPGHFHAALVQKEVIPGIDRRCHVYARLGSDLLTHLGRLAGFNARPNNPTAWEVEIHASVDPLARLLVERPGNVVVFSGRNRTKMAAIRAALEAGLHVLADKPWVIDPADLPILDKALHTAESNGLIALDIMTERHEITSIVQRELIQDPEIFGTIEPGSPQEPGVFMESVHYLIKQVAGVPLRRPVWFFDTDQQGEGLSDVGTHLVDLVPWLLFPEMALDAQRDVVLQEARRWPTQLSLADFQKMTGETSFPELLQGQITADQLAYFCNTSVSYQLRGVWVTLRVLWDRESTAGGDTHHARFQGSRSVIEVRQGKEENYRPEVYVQPRRANDTEAVGQALHRRITFLQGHYPGLDVEPREREFRLVIPDSFRVGHEAHFAEVMREFLEYLQGAAPFPNWEHAAMRSKYRITAEGVQLARVSGL